MVCPIGDPFLADKGALRKIHLGAESRRHRRRRAIASPSARAGDWVRSVRRLGGLRMWLP